MNFADIKSKKDQTAVIRTRLSSNVKWAARGVVRIFENQTHDEQNVEETRESNGIGFTGADANILSSFAKQVMKGRTMSAKQNAILLKKMPKYAGQLQRMVKVIVKAQTETAKPVELNLRMIDDEELLTLFHSLQSSIRYYEAAEGNYSKETDAREECYHQLRKAGSEAQYRGLL